jgi:hypothetical protein
MVKEFRNAIGVVMTLAALLAACAPAQSPAQVQSQIQTGVALTVQAQNQMATAVADTLTAQAPLPSATSTPTIAPLTLPSLTPLPSVTPFVVVPSGGGGGGGGGGGSVPNYACSFYEVKPLINVFKPGDPIDVVWIITNTGSKTWPDKKDLDYLSGTKFLTTGGGELPALKSGERVTVSFEGNAPTDPGYYEMKFKVEGGLCFPFTDIQVSKPGDP